MTLGKLRGPYRRESTAADHFLLRRDQRFLAPQFASGVFPLVRAGGPRGTRLSSLRSGGFARVCGTGPI